MEILIGVIIGIFILAKTNLFSSILPNSAVISNTSMPVYNPPNPSQSLSSALSGINQNGQLADTAVQSGVTVATDIAKAVGAASSVSSAIPVVGAAITALINQFVAASQQRAKEAVNENQAVDSALPPWDALIIQVAQMLSSGSISPSQAGNVLGTPRTVKYFGVPVGIAWQRFWAEVGPQVQPGRNGCSSGTVSQDNTSFCGGAYGAACCIAYDDMDNSMGNPNLSSDCFFGALKKAMAQPGTTFTATILGIYPSKYSKFSRPSYQVNITVPHV